MTVAIERKEMFTDGDARPRPDARHCKQMKWFTYVQLPCVFEVGSCKLASSVSLEFDIALPFDKCRMPRHLSLAAYELSVEPGIRVGGD